MDTAKKLTRLIQETEELLEKISDERAPHVQRLRDKLQGSLDEAKAAIWGDHDDEDDDDEDDDGDGQSPNSSGRPESQLKVRDVAGSLNDYVRRYPWLALATGVLVASSIGILSTHATKRSYSHD